MNCGLVAIERDATRHTLALQSSSTVSDKTLACILPENSELMRISSIRSLFIVLCILSGLAVDSFTIIKTTMPPSSVSNKRRRVALQIGSIDNANDGSRMGKLEELKQKEAELSKLLAQVRRDKISELHARPLKIGTSL